ncbi:hypothetical protein BDW74DRAFT_184309 [Aspergillus multicolor]|uniref:DUF2293 domain-containing protein n=1 Tax=Aspergillus multicolor TaxID=41759 RepID=UPI003CCE3DD6
MAPTRPRAGGARRDRRNREKRNRADQGRVERNRIQRNAVQRHTGNESRHFPNHSIERNNMNPGIIGRGHARKRHNRKQHAGHCAENNRAGNRAEHNHIELTPDVAEPRVHQSYHANDHRQTDHTRETHAEEHAADDHDHNDSPKKNQAEGQSPINHGPNNRLGGIRAEEQSPSVSPLAMISETHNRVRSKKALIENLNLLIVKNKKTTPKATASKPTNLQKCKLPTEWPSPEPFEKNCLERATMPADYVFVPRGNVYVTRHCRSQTKQDHRLVYKVYDNTGKKPLGIRVPANVYTDVFQSAEETAESRANAVKARDEKEQTHYREVLSKQFPLMPTELLSTILDHAFLKGSGRVGRTTIKSEIEKVNLAVDAHIRHVHTPYEALLRSGVARDEARKEILPTTTYETLSDGIYPRAELEYGHVKMRASKMILSIV